MSDEKPRYRVAARTIDSLQNALTGLGDPTKDKSAAVSVTSRFLSPQQLEVLYENMWIFRKAVDIPVNDGLRNWREWQADPKDIDKLQTVERELGLIDKLDTAWKAARLWGGAALVIGNRDDDYSKPLDPENAGELDYVAVLNFRDLHWTHIVQDPLSRYYGTAEYYTIQRGSKTDIVHPIHASRFVILRGNKRLDPFYYGQVGSLYASRVWGDSVLQPLYDQLLRVETVAANADALTFEATVGAMAIPGLMQNVVSPEFTQKLAQRLEVANIGKGVNKLLVHDSSEVFERHNYTFAGLDKIIQEFLNLACGAVDIPITRFLGQSPGGMNATGDSDLKNYYDKVHAMQRLDLEPRLSLLDELIIRKAFGGKRPPEIEYTWSPLWQLSETEKAANAAKIAEAAMKLASLGELEPGELRPYILDAMSKTIMPGIDSLPKDANVPGLVMNSPDDEGDDSENQTGDK